MPVSEHNWERFFQQQAESHEKPEKEGVVEKIKHGTNDKSKQEKKPPRKKINILPENAHPLALKLINNKNFKNKLKEFVAEIIVHGENITRVDVVIEKNNDKQLLEAYGITKEHFKDISNGNLTSFDLAADGPDLAIYFKRASGEPAIRPIDDKKLATILNIILNTRPEFAKPNLQSDIEIK